VVNNNLKNPHLYPYYDILQVFKKFIKVSAIIDRRF